MKTWPLIGFLWLIAGHPASAKAESPSFPPIHQILTENKDAVVTEFRQWRRDMIAAIRKTIEERVREDHWRHEGSKTHLAIVWAGELRATELTPLLIRHIEFRIWNKEFLPREDLYPAVRALILIGKSSSAACLAALGNEQETIRRKNLLLVIRRVEGEEATMRLVRKSVEEETDENGKANLRAALGLFSTKRSSTRP